MESFRKDINGLRAWAIVAVVLFHFGVPGFDGGFIGVDVFFVISGFLMTGIILENLTLPHFGKSANATSFSLIGFYLARARRILPALIALCAVLIIFGWFFLPSTHYKLLATHAVSALSFISNIKFWFEAGYFDVASHEKLLLHTWSLSVEWQFYLLFPVFLLILWKLWPNKRFIGSMLLLGFLVSLGISVIMAFSTPSGAFYLLPSRAWEMLSGAIIYFYSQKLRPSKVWSKFLEILGFGLILVSIFVFDSNTVWPGLQALVPVVGSMVVLLAAQSNSWLSTNAVAQWLGKTSYSLYLWHWPLSVGLIYLGVHGEVVATLVALLLTLVLAWASWTYIEQPAKLGLQRLRYIPQIAVLLLAIALPALPALAIRTQQGFATRLPVDTEKIFSEVYNINPLRSQCYAKTLDESCTHGGNDLAAIVVGDSHADAIMMSVANALPSSKLHILNWSFGGCPIIFGIQSTSLLDQECIEHLNSLSLLQETINGHVPILFLERISAYIEGFNEPELIEQSISPNRFYIERSYTSRTEEYYQEFTQSMVDTYCAIAESRKVYILRPIPVLKVDVPRTMGRAVLFNLEKRVSISMKEYEERHRIAWAAQDRAAEQCDVTLLDPRPYLCSEGRCWGDIDGLPIYRDSDHLSERGGQLLIPLFQQMFE